MGIQTNEGTQFTCFTGTKVQTLTLDLLALLTLYLLSGLLALLTLCLLSALLALLTLEALRRRARCQCSQRPHMFTLLDLLVQQY
jgi:hypothetical protein